MENDVVKMLFFQRQRQKKRWRIKTISGAPPLSFKAKAGALKDYKIYGNTVDGESVGDLETTGEHAGEYKVLVTVEGKNLLPKITATYSRNGLLLTIKSDGTVSINGTATVTAYPNLKENVSYPFDTILSGCPQGGSNSGYCLRVLTMVTKKQVSIDFGNGALIPANTNVYIEIKIQNGFECNNVEFKPMIRKVNIEDGTYEPYRTPVTTPIYLPEQIKKVGDEAEYISYADQKLHRVGAEDIDVNLPELPTLAGTNVLTVGTAVQPSEVEIVGKIKEI